MENNDTQNLVPKTKKTSKADNIVATIRSIIPKSPKGIYPFYDAFRKEIKAKHGEEDIDRAIFSKVFFPGPSKIAAEKIARRKFRWDPNENLDLSQIDHLASFLLERLTKYILLNPGHPCRQIYVEQIPEMLAVLTTVERETVNMKTMQLIYGRSIRKKKVKWIKTVATTEEIAKTEITEVKEIEVPTTVSINEPEFRPELETIPVLIPELVPEIISEIATEPVNSITEPSVISENITEPIPDPIMASSVESQITYQQEVDSSGIVDNNTSY